MPSASSAAGNLDNRHVEIVCAASAHVNVSVLYQFVDSATQPWPTSVAPRRGFLSRPGSAWPGRSQKDGLPSCRGESKHSRFKASTRAQGRGSPVAAPSNLLVQNDPNRTDHSASQNSNRTCIRCLLRLVEFTSTRCRNGPCTVRAVKGGCPPIDDETGSRR